MALPPHIPIAVKLMAHLVECAKEGRQTNYAELSASANLQSKQFSRPLGFIRDFVCAERNLPPLTVLVKNTGKDTPANSFAPSQLASLSAQDYQALRENKLGEVYSYPNWDRVFAGIVEICQPAVDRVAHVAK